MNSAQKRLVELKLKVPLDRQHEHDFLTECIKAWEGYDDMRYSYPAWQLRAIEKKYGLTVNFISLKYKDMAQVQDEKEALKCTYGDCQQLQHEDGEFCVNHSPTLLEVCYSDREEIARQISEGMTSGIIDDVTTRLSWSLTTDKFFNN